MSYMKGSEWWKRGWSQAGLSTLGVRRSWRSRTWRGPNFVGTGWSSQAGLSTLGGGPVLLQLWERWGWGEGLFSLQCVLSYSTDIHFDTWTYHKYIHGHTHLETLPPASWYTVLPAHGCTVPSTCTHGPLRVNTVYSPLHKDTQSPPCGYIILCTEIHSYAIWCIWHENLIKVWWIWLKSVKIYLESILKGRIPQILFCRVWYPSEFSSTGSVTVIIFVPRGLIPQWILFRGIWDLEEFYSTRYQKQLAN